MVGSGLAFHDDLLLAIGWLGDDGLGDDTDLPWHRIYALDGGCRSHESALFIIIALLV